MSKITPVILCGGSGTRTSERGRAAEECPSCRATGFLYPDPELRGLFRELLRDETDQLTEELEVFSERGLERVADAGLTLGEDLGATGRRAVVSRFAARAAVGPGVCAASGEALARAP